MQRKLFSQIFAKTSMWMLIPGMLALFGRQFEFALSLFACYICSFMHWSYVSECKPNKLWHNLDRLCVVIVLMQLNV